MPGDIRIVHVGCGWDLCEPITAVVYYGHFYMVVGGLLIKSFAGFVQNMVLSLAPLCFVWADVAFLQRWTENSNAEHDRQGTTITALKDYRMAVLYTFGRFD